MTPPPDTDAVPVVPVPAIAGEPACCCDGLQPGRVEGTATVGCCPALGLLDGDPATEGGVTALGLLDGELTVGPIVPPEVVPGDDVAAPGDDVAPPDDAAPPELAPPALPPALPPELPPDDPPA